MKVKFLIEIIIFLFFVSLLACKDGPVETIIDEMDTVEVDTVIVEEEEEEEIIDEATSFSLISFIPEDGAIEVPIDQEIILVFDGSLNENSVDLSTFSLTYSSFDNTPAGQVLVRGDSAFFSFNSGLLPNQTYTMKLEKGGFQKYQSELVLDEDYEFSFSTVDTQAPSVTSTVPENNSSDILPGSNIEIVFSEELSDASLTLPNFKLYDVSTSFASQVFGILSKEGNKVVFEPTTALESSNVYKMDISSVSDLNGNRMTDTYTLNFEVKNTELLIESKLPEEGTTNVSISNEVTIVFSNEIDASSVNSLSLQVGEEEGFILVPLSGTVSVNGSSVTFVPDNPLQENETVYTVRVSGDIKDVDGNSMSTGASYTFTTEIVSEDYYYYIYNSSEDTYLVADIVDEEVFAASTNALTNSQWFFDKVSDGSRQQIFNRHYGDAKNLDYTFGTESHIGLSTSQRLFAFTESSTFEDAYSFSIPGILTLYFHYNDFFIKSDLLDTTDETNYWRFVRAEQI